MTNPNAGKLAGNIDPTNTKMRLLGKCYDALEANSVFEGTNPILYF